MATKYVTLKDSNGDTLYPQAVATNLAPGSIDTTELADGAVTSAKIADGTIATGDIANSAVTSAKIDWSSVTTTSQTPTKNSNYVGDVERADVRIMKDGLAWVSLIFKLSATVPASSNTNIFTGLPGTANLYFDVTGMDATSGKPVRMRITGAANGSIAIAYDTSAHNSGSFIIASFCYPTR